MSEDHQFVLDLDHNEISVNERNQIDQINVTESNFSFQLLNPSRFNKIVFENINNYDSVKILELLQKKEKVKGTSYINFFFPIGENEQDFIDMSNAKKINVHTENDKWSVSQGTVTAGFFNIVVSCLDKTELNELLSVYFRFDNIISYAKIGQTCVYVNIVNVIGITETTKVFSISKRVSLPKVHKFLSEKTTFKPDQQTELAWKISNDNYAVLQPGNIYVSERAKLNQLTVDVNKNTEYQLSVYSGMNHDSASVNVYISPPKIEGFSYDPKTSNVSWSTKYASTITLYTDKKEVLLEQSGTKIITIPANKQIALMVTGYEYSEYVVIQLEGLLKFNQCSFEMNIKTFERFVITAWNWHTTAVNSLTFQFSEETDSFTTLYCASTDLNGSFEYVSKNLLLNSSLFCESKEGAFKLDLESIRGEY